MYRKLTKIHPPHFCTLLLDKSREKGFARMFTLSRAYTPSLSSRSLEYMRSQQSQRLLRLSERTAASVNVYYEKSAALALILSQDAQKQLA